MSGSHRTKLLLAAGIKEMTAGTSFSRIRVGALCAHCGIDRRTFYYHFRDIYDLAAWMFNQIVDDCIPDSSGKFRLSGIKMVMDRTHQKNPLSMRQLEIIALNDHTHTAHDGCKKAQQQQKRLPEK